VQATAYSVITGRTLQAVRATSANTYARHWRGICRFAEVFGFDPCSPSVQDIRRVAACLNNASTQRGWLAAWALVLLLLGVSWPAKHDPVLQAIRAGTMRSQAGCSCNAVRHCSGSLFGSLYGTGSAFANNRILFQILFCALVVFGSDLVRACWSRCFVACFVRCGIGDSVLFDVLFGAACTFFASSAFSVEFQFGPSHG